MDKIRIMRASVSKWQRIIDGKGADGGVLDCPPCRIYYMLVCKGCPIATYTGKKFCKGTPYVDWYWHQTNVHARMRRKIYCEECTRLAKAMRDYMAKILSHLEFEQHQQAVLEPTARIDPTNSDIC
jgi:hypothetical protein